MRKIYSILFFVCVFGVIASSQAHAYDLSDFAIYQDDAGAYTIHDRNTIYGPIGSNHEVIVHDSNSTVELLGGGNLTVHNSNTIDGDVTFNGSVSLNTTHNSVSGTISSSGAPDSFTAATLPSITAFTSGGSNVTTGGALTPGSYGNLTQGATKSLNLTAGNYYFNSINLNDGNTINIDLTNGPVNIFVTNDVRLNNANDFVLNGGRLQDLFLEVHGHWRANDRNDFYGILYTPNDYIYFNNSNTISGALYSGSYVELYNDNTLNFSKTVAPEPASMLLFGIGGIAMAIRRKKQAA